MPNRILREGILTSPRVAKLGWAEEVFYRRLMSVVDDFGRYYADPGMLRAACYPRMLNKVSDSDVGKWLTVCVTAALVRVYEAQDSERYLELLDFKQQMRAKNSKFPQPRSDCVADAQQLKSNDHLDVVVSESVNVVDIAARFDEFWETWPQSERKQDKKKCREKWLADKLDPLADKIFEDIAARKVGQKWSDPQYIEGPLVYLNNRRWEDGFTPMPAATKNGQWWTSDASVIAKGESLGLRARPGESMDSFKGRVSAAAGAHA